LHVDSPSAVGPETDWWCSLLSQRPLTALQFQEAEEDTMSILRNFSSSLKRKGVIHSFTSSMDLAQFVLNEGFYIGFNGIITFKKAENVQEVVKVTPIERILFETDSPFLTPVPHRGKENAPYYLPVIAEKISELKDIELEILKAQVYQNSLDCFSKLIP
jgi:TatD DNase family protein